MGKKSRQKKLQKINHSPQNGRSQNNQLSLSQKPAAKTGLEKFLFYLVVGFSGLALVSPLIFFKPFYFPYVGVKSLFFMGCVEFAFFAWLCLIFYFKQYRPKLNIVTIFFALFLLIMAISTMFGADPARSFWSKYERMTGLLMWLHLFAWFLVLSSALKTKAQWKRLFFVSVAFATLLCLLFLAIETPLGKLYEQSAGKPLFAFSSGGGATLGNSSFLGAYLLFNLFIAIYLLLSVKRLWLRIFCSAFAALTIAVMQIAGARAALWASLGGIGLIFLIVWAFLPKNNLLKLSGKVVLIIAGFVFVALMIILFIPFEDNLIRTKFAQLASDSRFVNWNIAWKGFLEKPFFGWGPENYDILFPHYFNPCLFTKKCGGEIWFDRSHNIVWDTLSTLGIFGFISYLILFVVCFWVLFRGFIKNKTISLWGLAVFSAGLAAYFIQNITVFDMQASLMMFILFLSFIAFLGSKKQALAQQHLIVKRKWFFGVVCFFFLVCFVEFIVQPLKADNLVIKAISQTPSGDEIEKIKEQNMEALSEILTQNSENRVALYKKALATSALGKYQVRDFFAQHTQDFLRENAKYFNQEAMAKEIDYIVEILSASLKESPEDYRSALKLAQAQNLYAFAGSEKFSQAQETAQKALAMSPKNQQSYWTLAQNYLYQSDFEKAFDYSRQAIALEPNWLQSYQIAYQIAGFGKNAPGQEEIKQKAAQINPDWAEQLE